MNPTNAVRALAPSVQVSPDETALAFIDRRLKVATELLANHSAELDGLIDRVFGPEPPVGNEAKGERPISGKLSEIEAAIDYLETVINSVGATAARLRALA